TGDAEDYVIVHVVRIIRQQLLAVFHLVGVILAIEGVLKRFLEASFIPRRVNGIDELLHERCLLVIWISRTGIQIQLRIVVSHLLSRRVAFVVIVKSLI